MVLPWNTVIAGVYPGTFDPPTVAHLAVARAARRHAGLERIDLVVSQVGLGKEPDGVTPAPLRARRLVEATKTLPWLQVRVTDKQLIADIAAGYDAVILGADKWSQINDPSWYGSSEARDAALGRLPRVLVAPRSPFPLPVGKAEALDVDEAYWEVSSTAVRDGRWEWRVGPPEDTRVDPG